MARVDVFTMPDFSHGLNQQVLFCPVLSLDFNRVLNIHLLVYLEEFVCHWSVTMKHGCLQLRVSFLPNFVLHCTEELQTVKNMHIL